MRIDDLLRGGRVGNLMWWKKKRRENTHKALVA
jgi:hypothetical protein